MASRLLISDDVITLHRLFGGDECITIQDMQSLYGLIGGSANQAAERIYELMSERCVESVHELFNVMVKKEEVKDPEEDQYQLERMTKAWGLQHKESDDNKDAWVSVESRKSKSKPLNTDSKTPKSPSLLPNKLPHPSGEIKVVNIPPYQSPEVARENLRLYKDPTTKNFLNEIYKGRQTQLLVIMRGVPGSGKSTLAKVIYSVASTGGAICSADDYFTKPDGTYLWDPMLLTEAHKACQDSCERALRDGVAVVVIDNTNLKRFEVDTYVRLGVKYNYDIKLQEPPTEWKSNANILQKKNTHGVPKEKIKEMLDRFERLSVDMLIKDVLKKMDPSFRYNPPSVQAIAKRGAEILPDFKQFKFEGHTGPSNVPSKPLPSLNDFVLKATTISSSPSSSPAPVVRQKGTVSTFSDRRSRTPSSTKGKLCNNDELSSWTGSSRMGAVFPCTHSDSQRDVLFMQNISCVGDNDMTLELLQTVAPRLSNSSPVSSPRRSSWCEVPAMANNRDSVSPDEFPVLSPNSKGFSEEELFLLNSFPHCGQDELLHFFELCQNDLNDTISLLLDSGYVMSDDPSKVRPSLVETGRSAAGDGGRVNVDQSRRTASPVIQASRGHSSTTDLNHNEQSSSPFVRPKLPPTLRTKKTSSPAPSPIKSPDPSKKKNTISGEETIVVDGPDWVDLELPDSFLTTLYSKYGQIDGHDSYQLRMRDKQIRIPDELAFRLFGYVYLNAHRRLEEEENAEGETSPSNGDDDVSPDEYDFPLVPEESTVMQLDSSQMQEALSHYKELESGKCFVDSSVSLSVDEVMAIEVNNKNIDEQKAHLRRTIPRTLVYKLRLNELKKRFPTLSSEVLDDVLVSSEFNYQKSLDKLKSTAPHKFVETPQPPVRKNTLKESDMENSLEYDLEMEEYDPEKVAALTEADRERLTETAKIWENRTEALSKQLDNLRQNSTAHKNVQAARDYYANEANKLREDVSDAQRRYAFIHLIKLNLGTDPNKIDLHGQPVKHGVRFALQFLEGWVNDHTHKGRQLDVRIITGRGNHSRNKISRLRQQVMEVLSQRHYSFYTGCPGEFRVHLRPQK